MPLLISFTPDSANEKTVIALVSLFSSLIGAGIGLLGVYLTNKYNLIRQKAESEMEVRKEVYLRAVESVAAIRVSLLKLMNADSDENEQFEIMIKSINELLKIHLVGSIASIKRVEAYNELVAYAIQEIRVHRIGIKGVKYKIDNNIKKLSTLQESVVELRKRIENVSPGIPNSGRSECEASIAGIIDKIQKINAQNGEMQSELPILDNKLMQCVFLHSSKIGRLLGEVAISLRNDLYIHTDTEDYTELIKKSIANGDVSNAHFTEILKERAREIASKYPLI